MKHYLLRTGAAAAVIGTSACVWTHVQWLEPYPTRSESCVAGVTVYTDTRALPTPHQGLADIAATSSPGFRPDPAALENALRLKAARIGANGILVRTDRRGGTAVFIPTDSGRTARICGT